MVHIGAVQVLIYPQSIGTRVRLTHCRSYVCPYVLVRGAKQQPSLRVSEPFASPTLACCSPRTASPLELLALAERESQHQTLFYRISLASVCLTLP